MSAAKARGRFEAAVAEFIRCIEALSSDQLLAPLGKWTPRDIVAHLIGWNRYVVRGSRQLQRGELPFYDVDPGENFGKVNAALVEEYPEADGVELLSELRKSADELCAFLDALEESEWQRDFGVRHGDEVLTIRGTVDELIRDYPHHREQIETWVDTPSS